MTDESTRTPTWRRALVTGASSGIGRALALRLAAAGTDLVVVARSTDRLERLAAEIGASWPGRQVEVLAADLGDRRALARVEQRLASDDGPIDLCVNNAGFGHHGPVADLDVDAQTAMIDVNVVALTRLSAVAARTLRERGHGGILQVSSIAAFVPAAGTAVYNATKAYVTSFTESLHIELRGTGVHVTAVCPGFTRTEFQERAGYDAGGIPAWMWHDPDTVAAVALDAVAANRPVVVPGVANKMMTTTVRMLPGAVTRRVAGLFSSH